MRFAMVGARTGDLLTYRGKVLVHHNRAEYEFLCPNTRIVRVTDGELGQPWMRLSDHPGLGAIDWPLRREDFVDAG